MMIWYNSYDDEILKYFKHNINCLNDIKKMFRRFRSNNYFSFFKFYILFYYLKFIREYDSANEFDTFYNENAHKNLIKKTY